MKTPAIAPDHLFRGDEEYSQGAGTLAASVAFAVLVSGAIFFGLSQVQRTTAQPEPPAFEDLRAVVVPPPPPPPPQAQVVTSAPEDLPPAIEVISGAIESPLPDEIRVSAVAAVEIAEPAVTIKTDLLPGAFRPAGGQGDLGFEARRVYERSEVDRAVVALNRVSPKVHPDMLRGIQARQVMLMFIVGTDGTAHEIRVLQSVSPAIDALVVEAVENWTFRPARKNKKAVQQWVQLPVVLKDGSENPFRN